jgi:hypothetical protein
MAYYGIRTNNHLKYTLERTCRQSSLWQGVRSDLGANCAVEAGVEALAGHFRVKPGQSAKASTPLPPNPNAPYGRGYVRISRRTLPEQSPPRGRLLLKIAACSVKTCPVGGLSPMQGTIGRSGPLGAPGGCVAPKNERTLWQVPSNQVLPNGNISPQLAGKINANFRITFAQSGLTGNLAEPEAPASNCASQIPRFAPHIPMQAVTGAGNSLAHEHCSYAPRPPVSLRLR